MGKFPSRWPASFHAWKRQEVEGGCYDHGDRFVIVRELLGKYREGHENFIKSLYAMKAA
jgi:hypothetical protein